MKALLDAFGPKIGGRYNIGCKFRIMLEQSPLGRRAQELRYQALVGSLHGHAHNHLCQLVFLATYILRAWALRISNAANTFFPNQMPSPPPFTTQAFSIISKKLSSSPSTWTKIFKLRIKMFLAISQPILDRFLCFKDRQLGKNVRE